VLRAAVALAEDAERRIHAAGRTPPAHADVLALMIPAAAETVRAAKAERRAAAWHEEAARQAEAAAEVAQATVEELARRWLEASPGPRMVDLDPRVFRVELVRQDAGQESSC
jgi:hypothetical protein